MDLKANQAHLALPVGRRHRGCLHPRRPLAEPVAPAATKTKPQVAKPLQRTAEDKALQHRKRIELVGKLVRAKRSIVIEKDPTGSAWLIYNAVDETTGAVVRVWPPAEF